MGTSKDILIDEIHELKAMLDYVKNHYVEVYDEAESHFVNLEE